MPKKPTVPTYQLHKCQLHKGQLHKGSGQAPTIIDGKSIYLGRYNSAESQERFNDLKAEWRLKHSIDQYNLKIDHLALRYLAHAEVYYRAKDGTPTRTADNIRYALRPLVAVHGRTRIRDFGPKKLKGVRDDMIQAGHSRTYINSMIGKIKQAFRWGVEEELVPPQVDEKTARKYRKAGRTPSELSERHAWRTRVDPFAAVWGVVERQLTENPGLQAKVLFAWPQVE